MTRSAQHSIAIVGGGASGVILAAHLARRPSSGRVVLIERSARPGRGLAYSTTLPDHRLNVEAGQMGALADDPGHFWSWHRTRFPHSGESKTSFLQRDHYGLYLEDLFAASAQGGRVEHIDAECVNLSASANALELRLSNGSSIAVHHAVLTTGHDLSPSRVTNSPCQATGFPSSIPMRGS